jgi:hypothetical protein
MEQEGNTINSKPESVKFMQNLTPGEEAALIAKLKAEVDPDALESECRELLKKRDKGELIPFEQVLRDLYGTDPEENRERV